MPLHVQSFKTVEGSGNYDILLSAREAALIEECAPTPTRVATAVPKEKPVEFEDRHIEKPHISEEDVIARVAKSTIKEMVTEGLSTIIEDLMDHILRTLLHNAQSSIPTVVYNVVEKVVLDLMYKEVVEKTLDTHKVKLLDTGETAEGLSKRLLTRVRLWRLLRLFLGVKRVQRWKERNRVPLLRRRS